MLSAAFSARLLILTPRLIQVITSSTGEEDWVTSNTRSEKGHRLEALTTPR